MSAVVLHAVPANLTTQQQARSLTRTGSWIVLGAVLPIALWMTLAPLSMAVVAPAYVKVDLNRRPVQHLEGGIVREVVVRDGQHVKAGEPVLILGDVGVDADNNRLGYRINVERAGLARLEAEQARAAKLSFPPELLAAARDDERVAQALKKEMALFESRRDSLVSEVALMNTQRQHIGRERDALRAQIAQMEISYELQSKDLEFNRTLLKDGFISPARIAQMEATVVDYASKLEERRSELARAAQRLGDTNLRILQLQNAYVQGASDQLKLAVARVGEIEQEMRKSEDAAARQVVVAPADGEIIDLKFTSPGAVIRPGDPIAEVVPSDAQLMVEAHIRPEDINNVHVDQEARIKFTAFKYRSTAMAAGKVSYVSGDRLVDRATNMPYFNVMITVDAASLRAIEELKLQAGMPAEVYIEGSKQTALQYLAEPIVSTIRKAGRQL